MRRTPLTRHTPLQAKVPMARKPPKAKPGASVRARMERRKAEARSDGHSIPWREVRRVIYARCKGRCEVCGGRLAYDAMEAHHRRTRAIGPDCPGNALALCAHCHHVKVHAHPEVARDLGRIISRHDRNTCALHPVRLIYGLVFLNCDGTLTPVGNGSTMDP